MILKRLFDVVFSLMALIVLMPLFLIIAVWIKLDSNGPVFFRQIRVGLNGEPFKIYKFRTMITSQNNEALQITISSDNRITSIGQYLRKYKLDELAQFINVLLGQMSVVGPRPEVPYYIQKYPESLRLKILSMRPGITDKASIEFRNENELLDRSSSPEKTYIEKILPIKQQYYSEYIDTHTLVGDILIIWKTFMLVCKK